MNVNTTAWIVNTTVLHRDDQGRRAIDGWSSLHRTPNEAVYKAVDERRYLDWLIDQGDPVMGARIRLIPIHRVPSPLLTGDEWNDERVWNWVDAKAPDYLTRTPSSEVIIKDGIPEITITDDCQCGCEASK